jgi:UDP-glucose 4-epimerase
MKKILVTGGLGYIGSHTVVALQEMGFLPIIVDNLSNSRIEILDRIYQITGKSVLFEQKDVRDTSELTRIMLLHKPHAVIHFAAHKSVDESVKQPFKYYENNVGGMLSLLKAMKSSDTKKIVFSSSCTVYGTPSQIPIMEDSPLQESTSPYGSTKLIGEHILRDNKWVDSISLRYFNPIGAHESGLIGELPLGVPANLLPYLTQTVSGVREKLTVYGDDYYTPDGTCIRDYLHVQDLAEAHVAAVNFLLEKETVCEHFNVGTGVGYSVLEIIRKFEEVTGKSVPYEIGPRREGDIVSIWAETSKAKGVLGWSSKRDLKKMLEDAWKWQQNSLGLL